jgi:hypothetical protein
MSSSFYNRDEGAKSTSALTPSNGHQEAMEFTSPVTDPDPQANQPAPGKRLNERSTLVMLVTIALVVGAFNTVLSIAHLFSFGGMRDSLMSAYVIDGNTGDRRRVGQIVDAKQKQEHIKDYAKLVATALSTYRWYVPAEFGEKKPDPGFPVDSNGSKVPTAVYLGSFYLEPNYASKYLPIISAQMKSLNLQVENRLNSIFIPSRISQPQKQGEGKWLVRVTGTQKTMSEGGAARLIPVVKELAIREAPTMSTTLAEKSYKNPEMAKGLAEARSWGLVTTSISDSIRGAATTAPKQKTGGSQ